VAVLGWGGQRVRMKLVIQDTKTKWYLTKAGKWSQVALEAEKFVEPQAALTFAKGTTTKDFNVVIYFPSAKAA
jgi:hypothetical protein